MSEAALLELADRVLAEQSRIPGLNIVSGFDAVVDTMVRVVGSRTSPETFEPLNTISDFGGWVDACAGRSGLREVVLDEECAGGCTINMGDGIATLGFPLDVFANVGQPRHPAFDPLHEKSRSLVPLEMEPGKVTCMEFDDGKLMLAMLGHFSCVTPDFLKQNLGDTYRKACEQASAICFTCWSLYPYMTDGWRYLQEELLADLPHRPAIYLDLADPASRSDEDVREMLDTLQGFESIGRVTLSLNGTEANQLARLSGFEESDDDSRNLEALCASLRDRCGISEVGIHLPQTASAATEEETLTVPGPYCSKPKKSVGAGDRYNAGVVAGQVLGLSLEERLLLGTQCSGFFVRNARSATLPELIAFMRG